MSRKVIWTIIIIMTLALIGVGVIQFVWIKRAVDLDEKNFNDKVTLALNNVKKRLTTDASNMTDELLSSSKSSTQNDLIQGLFIDPAELILNIELEKLDKYLEKEIMSKNIDLQYEYGVYSVKEKGYIIVNGNYSAPIGDTTKSSNVAQMSPLYKAEFKINLFDDEISIPGHLNLYFPGKKRFLWNNVIGILVTSILFTGLILFCFSYTIYIILHQKKVSEMKTDFINNMTHEFKTPIATIALASDSILSPTIIENKDKVSRFVNIIKQENTRMLNQVEKVLQMAQIEKENIQLKFSPMDIHEIIESAIINAELKIQAKGGSITSDLAAKQSIINADSTHISSVINNLLDNAEKYSPDAPTIHISSHSSSKGIEVSIKDNGIGMTKEAQKLIFEKFYRVHTGNLHDVKGFGLGLSYVKAILEAHSGSVSVKSELGKGSTFTIFIPFKFNE